MMLLAWCQSRDKNFAFEATQHLTSHHEPKIVSSQSRERHIIKTPPRKVEQQKRKGKRKHTLLFP
jgi:hypothetical protein